MILINFTNILSPMSWFFVIFVSRPRPALPHPGHRHQRVTQGRRVTALAFQREDGHNIKSLCTKLSELIKIVRGGSQEAGASATFMGISLNERKP